MDCDALVRWKSQIATHQQRTRESKPAQQRALFNLAPVYGDPDAIDPFILRLCAMSFYQLPADGPGQACIYFVLDSAAQLILYVGESCRSSLRWKGEHDCKRYIDNYQDLHHRHGLKSAVNITFWWDAPVKAKLRQQMELSLISKWRSPFNRENWGFWGAPFVWRWERWNYRSGRCWFLILAPTWQHRYQLLKDRVKENAYLCSRVGGALRKPAQQGRNKAFLRFNSAGGYAACSLPNRLGNRTDLCISVCWDQLKLDLLLPVGLVKVLIDIITSTNSCTILHALLTRDLYLWCSRLGGMVITWIAWDLKLVL